LVPLINVSLLDVHFGDQVNDAHLTDTPVRGTGAGSPSPTGMVISPQVFIFSKNLTKGRDFINLNKTSNISSMNETLKIQIKA